MAGILKLHARIGHVSQTALIQHHCRRTSKRCFIAPLQQKPVLPPAQYDKFVEQVSAYTLDRPELAKKLLTQMEIHSEAKLVSPLGKVENAKARRKSGKGKTQFFAYLSVPDKLRVLELSGALGADAFDVDTPGKTAFFAALPGEVKYKSLREWQQERAASVDYAGDDRAPPRSELFKLGISQAAPMVGFGFLDNFLMLIFGEAIDAHFGLYVSTMAAAGLGNLCSNIAGLGLADYIEHASERMGLPRPKLSIAQRQRPAARLAGALGTIAGVTVGCLLGLVPLLFFEESKDEAKEGE